MADRVIDLLMKSKNSSGGYDIMHPFTKTANVKTNESIEVMLTNPVGSYSNGDVIDANTSVDVIIKKLVQQQIPPVYTAPSINLVVAGKAVGSYEAGTSCNPSLTSTFTAGDAGAITEHKITKNGTSVASGTATSLAHSDTFVLGDETVTFVSSCTYEDGAIKNDNFGDPYPSTSIKSGTVTSSSKSYTGFRKYFYGADNTTTAPTASAEIRALTGSTVAASNGKTFTLSVTAGQRRAMFAYPATLRDVTSVKYVEMGNDESKAFFTKTLVDVEGADGFTAMSYKVYTYIPDQAFPSNMTLNITI